MSAIGVVRIQNSGTSKTEKGRETLGDSARDGVANQRTEVEDCQN